MLKIETSGLNLRAFEQIDKLIFESDDSEEQLILVAKRCSTFARFSMIERAADEVRILREANPSYIPRVTAWIIFCEGLIQHFLRLNTKGTLERLSRSNAIAKAIQDVELNQACLAWIATAHFVDGRSGESIRALDELFGSATPIERGTLARAFLVLADLLSWSGHQIEAKSWYQAARANAVAYGDLSLQALIMLNSTSFEVGSLTMRDCLGLEIDNRSLRNASLSAASVSNLDQGIGQPYLDYFSPMLLAEVSVLEKNWVKAIELINRHIAGSNANGLIRLSAKHLAQRALANLRVGDRNAAINDCLSAEDALKFCEDTDDLAVIHSRLGLVYEEVGHTSKSAQCKAKYHIYVQEFGSLQSDLSTKLKPIVQAATRSNKKSPA